MPRYFLAVNANGVQAADLTAADPISAVAAYEAGLGMESRSYSTCNVLTGPEAGYRVYLADNETVSFVATVAAKQPAATVRCRYLAPEVELPSPPIMGE